MRPVIITRPEPEATQWVHQLEAAGQPAAPLPMMQIHPCRAAGAQAALRQALRRLQDYQAFMFVSSNAVRHMALHLKAAPSSVTATARLWAPGPGTARTLLQQGFSADRIDQPGPSALQFDSEALWAVVQPQIQPGTRVLVVRGSTAEADPADCGHGRQWLAEQIMARGGQVDFVPVYERNAPVRTPELEHQIASLCNQQPVWLFSSSECLHNLVGLAPQQPWDQQTALTTHPRIAEQARQRGFNPVLETQPTVRAIACSIKSLA